MIEMSRFSGGWFKAYREAWGKDLGDNLILWALWTALLHMATWKESKILWNGAQREIPPGTVVFGISEIADRWRCSRSVIKKWLHHLHKTERIVLETCPRGTLVTIRQWSQYQDTEIDACPLSVYSVTATSPLRVHDEPLNEEGKKERKKKEGDEHRPVGFNFEEVYQGYPKRDGSQRKKQGLLSCRRQVNTQEGYSSLCLAVKNYADHCHRKNLTQTDKVMQFATFVNGVWEEWVNPSMADVQRLVPITLEELV